MSNYFDTSVIGILIFKDEAWPAIRLWMTKSAPALVYSDFCIGELASATARRVRMRQITTEQGTALLADLPIQLRSWSRTEIDSSDIERAINYLGNFELTLQLPDAVHMATAARLGLRLVTADRAQYRAATALGMDAIDLLHLEESDS